MGTEATVTKRIYELKSELATRHGMSALKLVKKGPSVTTRSFRDVVVNWFGPRDTLASRGA